MSPFQRRREYSLQGPRFVSNGSERLGLRAWQCVSGTFCCFDVMGCFPGRDPRGSACALPAAGVDVGLSVRHDSLDQSLELSSMTC